MRGSKTTQTPHTRGNVSKTSIERTLPKPLEATFGKERRREPRYPTHSIALVRPPDPSAARIPAKVLDVSRGGMKLVMSTRFAPGTTLHIFLKQVLVIGEVRHCTAVGARFEHGIFIEHTFGGSIE